MKLPTETVNDAPLPARYQTACTAIAECDAIDECKDWADKMEAMRSYARQQKDETLEKTVIRIKARAIRRCGELLEEWQTSQKGGPPTKNNGTGDDTVNSQRAAAKKAGLSKRQEVQARRVAKIEKKEFDALVESDDPPSVAALAEASLAERRRLGSKVFEPPAGWFETRKLRSHLGRFVETMVIEGDQGVYLTGHYNEEEFLNTISMAKQCASWLRKTVKLLESGGFHDGLAQADLSGDQNGAEEGTGEE